jgi:hypothetical protein
MCRGSIEARNCDSAQFVVVDVPTGRPAADVWGAPVGEPAAVVAAVAGCPVGPDDEAGSEEEAGADEQATRPKTLMATSVTAVPQLFMALSFMRVE